MGRKVKFVLCFPHLPERQKPYHRFTKLNRKYFTTVNPETKQVEPAYDRFQFSQGDLMIPTKVTVTFSEEEHSVTVSVAALERDVPGCAASDDIRLVIMVVKEEYVLAYPLELGKRGDGGMTTEELDPTWEKEDVHLFAYAVNADESDASATVSLTIG